MKKIILGCTIAILNCYASQLQRHSFAQAHSANTTSQAVPQAAQPLENCSRQHITKLSKSYKPGEEFTCKLATQEWSCVVTTTGYSCDVDEVLPPKLDTVIQLTEDQQDWLQQNVIKSRKMKLLFRNDTHMKFRAAAGRTGGSFYLAKG